MFFSYTISVVLLSLAIYGLCQVLRDLWQFLTAPEWEKSPCMSLLIIVRNMEYRIEGLVRYLLQEAADNPAWCDIVIVDYGSDDLTAAILDRLALSDPILKVIHLASASRPTGEGLAFCQGEIVQILDFVNRLRVEDAGSAIRLVLRRE
ncbi:MAG TPA: glycosyltransferase [Selenomonadales bacterium]|nr:glycosyltransferase [Selenomonadales bacterium]